MDTAEILDIAEGALGLPSAQQEEIRHHLSVIEAAEKREVAHGDFLEFVKQVWPAFIEGDHHRVMANAFNRIADGELKRLIINMPPRHTKSEFASYLFSCLVSREISRQESYPDGSHCRTSCRVWSQGPQSCECFRLPEHIS